MDWFSAALSGAAGFILTGNLEFLIAPTMMLYCGENLGRE